MWMDKGHWREKQGECAECFRKDLMSKYEDGTCLVVQWLRLHTPNAGGLGSIPDQGTRS